MAYSASVITCSDRAAADVYEDRSGPVLRDGLTELGFQVAEAVIVPDEVTAIGAAITDAIAAGARVVVTTGGTGIAPRDVTVEATRPLLSAELPGLMEEVRRRGAQNTPHALLSRGLAGIVRTEDSSAVVVNAPGSRGGARDTLAAIGGLLAHVVEQLDGKDHPMDPA